MAKVDVTRRDISASAEILAERVRVRPVKKHTRTTEYDFNYELIRARAGLDFERRTLKRSYTGLAPNSKKRVLLFVSE